MQKLLRAAAVPVIFSFIFYFLSSSPPPLAELRQQIQQQIECVALIPLKTLREAALQLLTGDQERINEFNKKYAKLKVDIEDKLGLDINKLNDTSDEIVENLNRVEKIINELKQKRSSISKMSEYQLKKIQQQLEEVFERLETVGHDFDEAQEQLQKCHELSIAIKQELIVHQLELKQSKRWTMSSGIFGILAPLATAYMLPPVAAIKFAGVALSAFAGWRSATRFWNLNDLEGLFEELAGSLQKRLLIIEKARKQLKQMEKRRDRLRKEHELLKKF